MRRSRFAAGLGLVTGLLAFTGCGPPESHDTAGTPPAPSPASPPPTSTTPSAPPPRPFEMPLDDVGPCDILTESQRDQLGFDREPLADSEGGFGDAPTCSFRNSEAKIGARLSLITTESMNVWTSDTAQVEASPLLLHEFPALLIKTPSLDLACNVAVDVAEGQHLDVLYRDDGAEPRPPLDQLCTGAKRVAEEAVAALKPEESEENGPSDRDPTTPTAEPSVQAHLNG